MAERVERPNTLIITVPKELLALSFAEFVDKLVESLGQDNIRCIQFVPRHFVRVTFTSFDARNTAFQSGVFIGSVRLFVVEADPKFKDVYLEHLPAEVPDDAVYEAFRPFGSIREIVHLKYAGSHIYTGTRLLKVALASDVPVNLRIVGFPCRVFYRGQPRPCAICRSTAHRTPDCPLRDVCRVCREPGHFARDCPGVVPVLNDDDAPPVADVVPNNDDLGNDDTGDVPNNDDLENDDVANDDVQSAQVPSPVPEPEPMFTDVPYWEERPTWVQRLPESVRGLLDPSHSSDTHLSFERYVDRGDIYMAFDFGRCTFKVIKDFRSFEDQRDDVYKYDVLFHPRASQFAAPAVDLPPLSAVVVPARFPDR